MSLQKTAADAIVFNGREGAMTQDEILYVDVFTVFKVIPA